MVMISDEFTLIDVARRQAMDTIAMLEILKPFTFMHFTQMRSEDSEA